MARRPSALLPHGSEISEYRAWLKDHQRSGYVFEPNAARRTHFFFDTDILSFFNYETESQKLNQLISAATKDSSLYARDIANYCPRVFSILLTIGKERYIDHFASRKNLHDSLLPFESFQDFPELPNGQTFWQEFNAEQWKYCVVRLEYSLISRTFKPNAILPILSIDELNSQADGSAVVGKVKIHPQYDALLPPIPSQKRLAMLRSTDDLHTYMMKSYRFQGAAQAFNAEVEAFSILNRTPEPSTNIIGLYKPFMQNDTFHLILQYANVGTLEDYFQVCERPSLGQDTLNLWTKLFRLNEAADRAHTGRPSSVTGQWRSEVVGWHQDINPSNILVIGDLNKDPYEVEFMLGDTGLSQFTKNKSRDEGLPTRDIQSVVPYGAPERNLQTLQQFNDTTAEGKEKLDIWGLACVYSEFNVWIVQGAMGLEAYRQARTDEMQAYELGCVFHNEYGAVLDSVVTMHQDTLPYARAVEDCVTPLFWNDLGTQLFTTPRVRPNLAQLMWKSGIMLDKVRHANITNNPSSSRRANTWTPASRDTRPEAPSPPRTPPELPPEEDSTPATDLRKLAHVHTGDNKHLRAGADGTNDDNDDALSEVSSAPPSLISDSTNASIQDKYHNAVEHLVDILCAEDKFGPVYHEAVQNFQSDTFLHNHDQLLKLYFKELRLESRTGNEVAAVRLLRTRSCRSRVTSLILQYLQPFGDADNVSLTATSLETRKIERNYALNQMLLGDGRDKQHDADNSHDDDASVSSESSTESHDDSLTQAQQPLQAIDAFLSGGRAFAHLGVNLASLLRPPNSLNEALSTKSVFVIKQYISRNLNDLGSSDKENVSILRKEGKSNTKIAEILLEKTLGRPPFNVGSQTPIPATGVAATKEDTLGHEDTLHNDHATGQATAPIQPALIAPTPNEKTESYHHPQMLTWRCSCGVHLHDYYTETVPGGFEQFQRHLRAEMSPSSSTWQNLRDVLVTWTTSTPSTPQNGTGRQTSLTSESRAPRGSSGSTEAPSRSNATNSNPRPLQQAPPLPGLTDTHEPLQPSSSDPRVSYLLLCFPEGLSGLKLHHQQIMQTERRDFLLNHVTNDRQLFQLLRKKYATEKRLFFSKFWPKTVIRVSLAYFLVDLSGYAELRHYACQDGGINCKCIPPPDMIRPAIDAQYHCVPREPPLRPPIGPGYLTYYFQHPDHIESDSLVCTLNQVPKRLGQCMAPSGSQRIEAWGMEFEEGWDRGRLRNAIFAILVLGCILFFILWWALSKDMQGAFGGASFFVAILGIVGGYVASAEPRIVHK